MKMNKKLIVATAACAALLVGSISTSLAWLMDTSAEVENTFVISTIGVNLTETENTYQMIPGWDIDKDPKAWITEGSQPGYLFVKIEESSNFDDFMTYTIAEGWTVLPGMSSEDDMYVIYRTVTSTDDMGETKASAILAGDKVTVKESVTKAMMTASDFTQPTLTFTPYVHQLYANDEKETIDVSLAWGNVKDATPLS